MTMAATSEQFSENNRNLEDAISYTSRGGVSMAGLLDSGRFGISNFAKPKSGKFSNFWKVFLAIFGVVLVAVLVWSFTQKSKKDENSVHIDDYQSEKIKKLESQFDALEKNLNKDKRSSEKKFNDQINNLKKEFHEHISHFITSQMSKNDDSAPIVYNLTSISDIPNLKVELDQVKDKLSSIQDLSTRIQSLENQTPSNGNSNEMNVVKSRLDSLDSMVNFLKSSNNGNNGAPRKVPQTCEEVFKDPTALSKNYTIDPDGEHGPILPFTVFCDATKRATIVYHDKMTRQTISNCNTSDCFNLNLTYKSSLDQVMALIDFSQTCRQMIQFDCKLSPLINYGTWSDRYNTKQSYFAGANFGQKTCDCGSKMPNECFQLNPTITNMCNCDQKDTENRNDIGYITNRTALPIRSFHYGLMYQSDQEAAVTIGALECKGQTESNLEGGSCKSLKLQGRPTGYYLLDTNNGTDQPVTTTKPVLHISKCNMSLSSNDPNFQMDLGFVTLFSGRVHVIADITQQRLVKTGTAIQFDNIIMDLSGSFYLQNSTFVAPWNGMFTFTKHRFRCTNNDRDMYGYVGGDEHDSFEIRTSGSDKYLNEGQFVVITRQDSTITLGCNEPDPCRLTIKGEE